MHPAEFVDALRRVVAVDAAKGVLAQLEKPSGRCPSAERLCRAAWFNSLPVEDRQQVESVVAEAAKAALFGMLCVLDGVRAIRDGTDDGHLELRYIEGGTATLLASTAAESPALFLHDFF